MSEFPERTIKANQFKYNRWNYKAPKYKYSRLPPLNGSQQVDIPITSTAETLFEIPTVVHNLSESVLHANVSYSAQGDHTAPDGRFSWIHVDGMPLISEVDLYTRSGTYLCQLPNFQKYMKVVRKIYTKRKEYESNNLSNFLAPSNSLPNASGAVTPNNGVASVPYKENSYVISNGTLGLGADTEVVLTLEFPLSAIKKTIFELNKDIVFPDIVVLRILWGPSNQALYYNLDGNNPNAAGATAPINGFIDRPAPASAAGYCIRISDLTLYLAVEQNGDLAQEVRQELDSRGLNLLVDYPHVYKQPLSGTSQSMSLRFNRGHGKNIVSVISSVFNNQESLQTAYDNFNIVNASTAAQSAVGAKVTSYYSQLDNVRLQDINLVCSNAQSDDYRQNKRYLEDSPYYNQAIYQNNWFHMDVFAEPDSNQTINDEDLDKGLSLVVERKYDLMATTANANHVWLTTAICQRDLHIGRDAIQWQ